MKDPNVLRILVVLRTPVVSSKVVTLRELGTICSSLLCIQPNSVILVGFMLLLGKH